MQICAGTAPAERFYYEILVAFILLRLPLIVHRVRVCSVCVAIAVYVVRHKCEQTKD